MTFTELVDRQMQERIDFVKIALIKARMTGKNKTAVAADIGMSVQSLVQFMKRNGIEERCL